MRSARRSRGGRVFRPRVVARLGAAMAVGSLGLTASPALTTVTSQLCAQNVTKVDINGVKYQQVEYPDARPLTTFDAKDAQFLSYPTNALYPFTVGKDTAPAGVCVIGGIVKGQQSRGLTWDQMKDLYDGDAVRVSGNGHYVIDGVRVDNVEDAIAPRGTEDRHPKDGDGFVIQNAYTTYIRDDCVENDDIGGGLIIDSLFDGCYTGISERPSSSSPQNNWPAPPGETLRLHKVLLRLEAMPGPYGTYNPAIKGHGQLFKWSDVSNRLVVTDSIFLVEKTPNSDSYFPFPPGTITSNVKIVWLGGGTFNWSVPPGTTVTSNRSVWDTARAEWLARHGCTSFSVCSKLHTPDPDVTL